MLDSYTLHERRRPHLFSRLTTSVVVGSVTGWAAFRPVTHPVLGCLHPPRADCWDTPFRISRTQKYRQCQNHSHAWKRQQPLILRLKLRRLQCLPLQHANLLAQEANDLQLLGRGEAPSSPSRKPRPTAASHARSVRPAAWAS